MTDEPDPSICGLTEIISAPGRIRGANRRQTSASHDSNRVMTSSLIKLLVLLIAQLPLIHAVPVLPIAFTNATVFDDSKTMDPDISEVEPSSFWLNFTVSVVLVLLGGVFAGLTLGLMGQDEVYLQVMKQSGSPKEQKAADKVLQLLSRGKHWVLVTLLLANVITNETLPIVLDRCLGGGWPAVVSSTVLIVIFGEIIPQSISVRYGLAVGATFAPFVLGLMYLLYPLAVPVAKLLDRILGQDHGTIYKRAGLKTLVTLHKSVDVEGLNEDEVTIISAVLDLKEKPVSSIMIPIEDVFVLSSDTILDEKTVEKILHLGFNRIPIYHPGEPSNFVGMLLVRTLITYDPEDAMPISSFPLATLPETDPDSSCLNILNYFQEGKSHMVVVSNTPGKPTGAIGVLTLEDVIEELIGEEIIDESDVYVDVHKAIRRVNPGPLTKKTKGRMDFLNSLSRRESYDGRISADFAPALTKDAVEPPQIKLGPSNKASDPRMPSTKSVTIKRVVPSHSLDSSRPLINISDTNGATASQDDQVMNPKGSIYRTEKGAIRAALNGESNQTNEESASNEVYNADSVDQVHSYRAGSLIESIVNVKGINKVVIGEGKRRSNESLPENSTKSHRSDVILVKNGSNSSSQQSIKASDGKSRNGFGKDSIKRTGKRIFGKSQKQAPESKPLMSDSSDN